MSDLNRLATYNAERSRGIAHTEAYQREMAVLQEEYKATVNSERGPYLTPRCRRVGGHSRFMHHRRRGPFWARRDEYRCMRCGSVVDPFSLAMQTRVVPGVSA